MEMTKTINFKVRVKLPEIGAAFLYAKCRVTGIYHFVDFCLLQYSGIFRRALKSGTIPSVEGRHMSK